MTKVSINTITTRTLLEKAIQLSDYEAIAPIKEKFEIGVADALTWFQEAKERLDADVLILSDKIIVQKVCGITYPSDHIYGTDLKDTPADVVLREICYRFTRAIDYIESQRAPRSVFVDDTVFKTYVLFEEITCAIRAHARIQPEEPYTIFYSNIYPKIRVQHINMSGADRVKIIAELWEQEKENANVKIMKTVETLIMDGASIDSRSNIGSTALMFAAQNEMKEVAKVLVTIDINPNLITIRVFDNVTHKTTNVVILSESLDQFQLMDYATIVDDELVIEKVYFPKNTFT